tara:strand:+ start:603 stop:1004 length:402 start_codon:yes stop_codon:yes gene_type:complete
MVIVTSGSSSLVRVQRDLAFTEGDIRPNIKLSKNNFFIIWIYEKILSYFNIYPNYAALGFSGIIYALFGFLLLSSFYGKNYFLGKKIGLKSNFEVQKMSKTICIIGLIFSFLPGVSLLGHLSGFVAGCFLFLI